MNRLNAMGVVTNKAKITRKANIKGRITKLNRNYKAEDVDGLEPLFPEELDAEFSGVKQNRGRMTSIDDFPERLPTAGLFPYPLDEDEFIGQYESPKNIYLTLAHAYNKAIKRIEVLEQEVKNLKIR